MTSMQISVAVKFGPVTRNQINLCLGFSCTIEDMLKLYQRAVEQMAMRQSFRDST